MKSEQVRYLDRFRANGEVILELHHHPGFASNHVESMTLSLCGNTFACIQDQENEDQKYQ